MSPGIDLLALRQEVVKTIREAAAMLCGDAAWIADKGGDGLDLVTSLDLAVQAYLVARLPRLLEHSVACGEEEFQAFTGADRLIWLIDPLDGTVNFAAGLPFFAISVALLVDGETALAAVWDAPNDCVYSAVKGQGAFLGDELLVQPAKRSQLAALSSGLLQDLARHHPHGLAELLRSYKVRNLGSQALQLCYAATGALSFVASREAKGWDDAAGALIATEAGLKYGTYRDGRRAVEADQFSLCAAQAEFSALAKIFGKSCALANKG
ncbi:hypothetical protein A8M32_25480 [Sinorhizobium alkalisoli]|uniref:Inositol monophosphatase n=2 Tax=Sinorhizobium alkalisoli TaxID=1752398 RepID=A0A1E3V3W3_9HYPH|nr:hypothetical protein A8M32_25480 [Sinorhizobium alkalisoli]